jgi:hypothetical protein
MVEALLVPVLELQLELVQELVQELELEQVLELGPVPAQELGLGLGQELDNQQHQSILIKCCHEFLLNPTNSMGLLRCIGVHI